MRKREFKPPKLLVEKYTRQDGSVYYKVRKDRWWWFDKEYIYMYNSGFQSLVYQFSSVQAYEEAIRRYIAEKKRIYNSSIAKVEVV